MDEEVRLGFFFCPLVSERQQLSVPDVTSLERFSSLKQAARHELDVKPDGSVKVSALGPGLYSQSPDCFQSGSEVFVRTTR